MEDIGGAVGGRGAEGSEEGMEVVGASVGREGAGKGRKVCGPAFGREK